jgi:hypothetical protein
MLDANIGDRPMRNLLYVLCVVVVLGCVAAVVNPGTFGSLLIGGGYGATSPPATTAGGLTVEDDGTLSTDGDITTDGDLAVGGGLGVTGSASIGGEVAAETATVTSDATIGGVLEVSGASDPYAMIRNSTTTGDNTAGLLFAFGDDVTDSRIGIFAQRDSYPTKSMGYLDFCLSTLAQVTDDDRLLRLNGESPASPGSGYASVDGNVRAYGLVSCYPIQWAERILLTGLEIPAAGTDTFSSLYWPGLGGMVLSGDFANWFENESDPAYLEPLTVAASTLTLLGVDEVDFGEPTSVNLWGEYDFEAGTGGVSIGDTGVLGAEEIQCKTLTCGDLTCNTDTLSLTGAFYSRHNTTFFPKLGQRGLLMWSRSGEGTILSGDTTFLGTANTSYLDTLKLYAGKISVGYTPEIEIGYSVHSNIDINGSYHFDDLSGSGVSISDTKLGASSLYCTRKYQALGSAPSGPSATGTAGEIRYTADYIYVCTATNTWKRSELTTWSP